MTRRVIIAASIVCFACFWVFVVALEPAAQTIALAKCFIVFPLLLLVPGFFIHRSFARTIRFPLAMLPGVFFSFSLMLYLPLTLVAYALQMPIATYSWLCVACAMLAVFISMAAAARIRTGNRGFFATRMDVLFFAIVLLLAMLVAFLTLAKGTFLFLGDLWLHMSIVRKFFTRGVISPESPLFITGGFDSNYSYNLWHPLLGAVTYFSRLKIEDMWFNAPGVISLIALATYYGFAQFLFRSRVAALVTLLLMMYDMLFGDIFFQGILAIHYPYSLAPLIVLPVLWVLIIEYLRRDTPWLAAGALLASVVVLFLHKLTYLEFVLHLAFFFVCLVLISPRRKNLMGKMAVLLAAVMAVAVVYVAVFPSLGIANPLHRQFAESDIARLGRGLVIVKPEVALTRAGIIVSHKPFSIAPVVALLLFPYVAWQLFRRRAQAEQQPAALFIFSGMLILPLVMLNPIAGGIIAERFSSQSLVRLYHALPYYFVIGFVSRDLYLWAVRYVRRLQSKSWRTLARNMSCVSAAALVLVSAAVFYPRVSAAMKEEEISFYRWKVDSPLYSFLETLDEREAQPKIILADLTSGYFITALTKHYVTMIVPALSSPSMKDFRTRYSDLMQFLKGRDARRAAQILREYNVSYIVVADRKQYPGLEQYMDSLGLPGLKLQKIFSSPDLLAYKVVPG